jgi:hypothetical protein
MIPSIIYRPYTSACISPTHKKYDESTDACLEGGSRYSSLTRELQNELDPCDTDRVTNQQIQKNRKAAINRLKKALGEDKLPSKLRDLKKEDIVDFLFISPLVKLAYYLLLLLLLLLCYYYYIY